MAETPSTSAADVAELGGLVDRLAKIGRTQGLATLSLSRGDLSVDLTFHAGGPSPSPAARVVESAGIADAVPSGLESDLLTSPMVGTFYVASGPGEPAFVEVGDDVEVGQTVGIVEAMKIMNEIPAELAGTILEVLVGNGQAVEYGTPLFRVAVAPEA